MTPRLENAEYAGGYRIRIRFADGRVRSTLRVICGGKCSRR